MLELMQDRTIHSIDPDTREDDGYFCCGFEVNKVLSDIHTGDETAVITIFTDYGDKTVNVPLSSFTRSSLPKALISKGIDITDIPSVVEAVLDYAMESKKTAPVQLTYEKLGWQPFFNRRAYLAHNIVLKKKLMKECIYKHTNKLSPRGSFEAWKEGLDPFLSLPTVTLALIIGASATVIPLLKMTGIFSETPIFALIGQSSTYKTTMLKLMAGIYGKPSIGDGIIDTMLDTTNYFFCNLSKKVGFLHCVDDISAAHGHDFSNELYSISMGKSRGRLASDGSPKDIQTWCTTMVYTGETSIFVQTNKNPGLYARLIEFTNCWLTPESDINSFFQTINNNYGVALEPLVQTLFTLTKEDIKSLYESSLQEVNKAIEPIDGIGKRMSQRFAILLMTLLVCNMAWDLDLKIPPVMALLKEAYESNLPPVDPTQEAIDNLKEQIVTNGSMFVKDPEKHGFPQNLWGIYGKFKNKACLWIAKGKFEQMAKTAKIKDLKALQRQLADRGFLARDSSNHYTLTRNITPAIKTACYGVYLDNNIETPKKQVNLLNRRRTSENFRYLIDDTDDEDPGEEVAKNEVKDESNF